MKIYLCRRYQKYDVPEVVIAFDDLEAAKRFNQTKYKEANESLADTWEKIKPNLWAKYESNYESFVENNKVIFDIKEIELSTRSEAWDGGAGW